MLVYLHSRLSAYNTRRRWCLAEFQIQMLRSPKQFETLLLLSWLVGYQFIRNPYSLNRWRSSQFDVVSHLSGCSSIPSKSRITVLNHINSSIMTISESYLSKGVSTKSAECVMYQATCWIGLIKTETC